MRKLWFYILVLFIWVGILFMGMGIYRRFQEKTEVVSSYYDWEALLDEEFRCIDQVDVDVMIPYKDIGVFMEMVSDGMFEEVNITKDENLQNMLTKW